MMPMCCLSVPVVTLMERVCLLGRHSLHIQANLGLGSVSEKKRAQFWREDFPKGLQTAGHKDAQSDQ